MSAASSGFSLAFTDDALRQLRKLDPPVARRALDYLEAVADLSDPRARGKGLAGDRAGIWRYRMGDLRVLCEIQDRHLVVLLLQIGHRSRIYDD